MTDRDDAASATFSYHRRTKHEPGRYARSAGYLDWANEPDPFRRYEGVRSIPLPLITRDRDVAYEDLYLRHPAGDEPLTLATIGAFLELSLGLSAWKSFRGSSWALRMNPSSGNLHPTEGYLVLPPIAALDGKGGLFHYDPFSHALEERAAFEGSFRDAVGRYLRASRFLLGLSSIVWRESWKYGERAFRYCSLDIGHAVACLSLSAGMLGWRFTAVSRLSDRDLSAILGFDRTEWREFEAEVPEALFLVHGREGGNPPREIPTGIARGSAGLSLSGIPNRLSREHMPWPAIDEVVAATGTPSGVEEEPFSAHGAFAAAGPSVSGPAIIRQRRSGQTYDGAAVLARGHLFGMLDRVLPRAEIAPFDAGIGRPSVHLLLFIHRVSGISPGLYFLVRNRDDLEDLKHACRADFVWESVADMPERFPFYLLQPGDFRETAGTVSCHQEIARDGMVLFAMIARYREEVSGRPWRYRRLHWEAGMIGQVLYLESEARGVRGTGIGCFFDDLVHDILGFRDETFQDIYHFTLGMPIEDSRLTTLPPYHHLTRKR